MKVLSRILVGNDKMRNAMKFIYYIFSAVAAAFLISAESVSAASKTPEMIKIRVVNDSGEPIEGARVSGEGILGYTDFDGVCYIKTDKKDLSLSITASGYFSKEENLNGYPGVSVLVPSLTGDIVDDGYMEKNADEMLSSYSAVAMEGRMKFDNFGDVASYINGLLGGLRTGTNYRGIGTPLYVIDGVPGRDVSMVSPSEIESITFLRDANALALYGSRGVNGVVVIKTKRGRLQKNEITVTANYGIRIPVAFPEYLGAAEYMSLYNEARENDGLLPLYGTDLIELTASGENPYKYPDVDFYSDDYMKKFTDRADASVEFRGGTDALKYYVNMRYGYTGTLEKVNPDVDRGANDYQIRANLDFRINRWITSSVDVSLMMSQNRDGFVNLLAQANGFRPNLYCPLIPVEYLSESLRNSEMFQSVKVYDGYILGGSSSYKGITPFAQIFGRGYSKKIDRNTQVGNTIDFDLGMITKGLYAKTSIGFDYYDKYNVNLENKFNFYEPVWLGDEVIDLVPLGETDSKAIQENVAVRDFLLRYGGNVQIGYDRTFAKKHNVSAMVMAQTFSEKYRNVKQTDVDSYISFDAAYNYDRRYYVDFTGSYLNSTKLAPGNRGQFVPAVSAGWVISNESFLENAGFLDFLRLRASYAKLATDTEIDAYYLYQDVYDITDSGAFTWNDGGMSIKRTKAIQGRNLGLGFVTSENMSIGIDAEFLKSIRFEGNVYRVDRGNFVKLNNITYPGFYDDFSPYYNNGIDRYQGVELALNYHRNFGDFKINAGFNFIYSEGIVKSADELPVEYEYLSTIGQRKGSIRGLKALGFYQENDFNPDGSLKEGLPVPDWGTVKPGDIKYLDKNGDKKVDTLDEEVIGLSLQPYSLGLNLYLQYRNISLYLVGRGMIGGDGIKNHSTYYWADETDKYSTEVRGRWTKETAETATFPRLTTGQSNNNYRTSTFWLYDKSYFDLAKVQLTYSLPSKICRKMGFNTFDISLTGTNLLKIAPERKILELNIGGAPNYRAILLGVRFGL